MTIRSWLQANHHKYEQFRRDVEEANVRSVQGLVNLSDEELSARDPSIPFRTYLMEMQRRLKVAIQELTRETAKAL